MATRLPQDLPNEEEQTLAYREALLRAQERELNDMEEQLSRKEAEFIRTKFAIAEKESQLLDRQLSLISKTGKMPSQPLHRSLDLGTGDYKAQELARMERAQIIGSRAEMIRARLAAVEARRASLESEEENLNRTKQKLDEIENEIKKKEEFEKELSEGLFGSGGFAAMQAFGGLPQQSRPPMAYGPALQSSRPATAAPFPPALPPREPKLPAAQIKVTQSAYLGGGAFAGEISVPAPRQVAPQPIPQPAPQKPPAHPPPMPAQPAQQPPPLVQQKAAPAVVPQAPPQVQPPPPAVPPPLPPQQKAAPKTPTRPSMPAAAPAVPAAPAEVKPQKPPAPAAEPPPKPAEAAVQSQAVPPPLPQQAAKQPETKSGKELRQDPRVDVEVEVGLNSGSNFFLGFSSNISKGGLFVETHMPLSKGHIVNLTFTMPDGRKMNAEGEVAWVKEYNDMRPFETPGMGIKFRSLTPADEKAIGSFLNKREPIFFEE